MNSLVSGTAETESHTLMPGSDPKALVAWFSYLFGWIHKRRGGSDALVRNLFTDPEGPCPRLVFLSINKLSMGRDTESCVGRVQEYQKRLREEEQMQ